MVIIIWFCTEYFEIQTCLYCLLLLPGTFHFLHQTLLFSTLSEKFFFRMIFGQICWQVWEYFGNRSRPQNKGFLVNSLKFLSCSLYSSLEQPRYSSKKCLMHTNTDKNIQRALGWLELENQWPVGSLTWCGAKESCSFLPTSNYRPSATSLSPSHRSL